MRKKTPDGSVPFPQAEGLLSRLHQIAAANVSQIGGRMKHFARHGFPAGVNVGRGVALAYSFDQLMQLIAAFELVELGIPPQRIIGMINRSWPEMRSLIPGVWRSRRSLTANSVYWVVPSSSLHEWRYPSKTRDTLLPADEIVVENENAAQTRAFAFGVPLAFRYAHIHADALISKALQSLVNAKDLTPEQIDDAVSLIAGD